MMNNLHASSCKQLLSCLSEYIDGNLQPVLCQEIEEHLQNCEKCRVVVNTLRKTVELYGRSSEMASDLPEDVCERLFLKLDLDRFIR